ncbi:MAG: hypothetical protein K2R98_11545 [Gemmataceae bacterium]|nr:hypothetical protein [Gemmataceae bacterium]
MGVPKSRSRPFWVWLAVGGIQSRTTAMLCFWLAICLSIGGFLGGFLVSPWLFLGLVFVPAAPWYWFGIQWVDENSQWPATATKKRR